MIDYILISELNDFIFCPYSIYLHNAYMETDKDFYSATPQIQGTIAHESVDNKSNSTRKDVLLALPVFSEQFGIMGKIDVYKIKEQSLIERKYKLNKIYRGQIYQLWAQYLCLKEMGYDVKKISFYEISTNKTLPINLPTKDDIKEFTDFIEQFRSYDPNSAIQVNNNKFTHCIYCNLCDKTDLENVFQ